MHDKIPGLAPDPKMVLPFESLGITDRLRRPIFDHILLGILQTCKIKAYKHFRQELSSLHVQMMN